MSVEGKVPADGMLGPRVEGPSPAMAVAFDIVRRSVWAIPIAVIASAAFWGLDGVFSTLYGLAIVIVNFLLAGWLLQVGGRIGAAARPRPRRSRSTVPLTRTGAATERAQGGWGKLTTTTP